MQRPHELKLAHLGVGRVGEQGQGFGLFLGLGVLVHALQAGDQALAQLFSVDHVVGVFYAKDVLPLLGDQSSSCDVKVSAYMRKPLFVPESMGLVDLLHQFKSTRVQNGEPIEYGQTLFVIDQRASD